MCQRRRRRRPRRVLGLVNDQALTTITAPATMLPPVPAVPRSCHNQRTPGADVVIAEAAQYTPSNSNVPDVYC